MLPAKPKKFPGPKINPQKIPCRFCGPFKKVPERGNAITQRKT